MGITSARVGRSPPSHRWDHEDMLPATYSEAKELPRREWELRDLVIHVCHCRVDRKLELLELAVIRDQGQARDNE